MKFLQLTFHRVCLCIVLLSICEVGWTQQFRQGSPRGVEHNLHIFTVRLQQSAEHVPERMPSDPLGAPAQISAGRMGKPAAGLKVIVGEGDDLLQRIADTQCAQLRFWTLARFSGPIPD
jgi:hypothetical protein